MLGDQRPCSQRNKRTMFVTATLLVCNARCNCLNVTVFDRPLHSAGGQVGPCCLTGANPEPCFVLHCCDRPLSNVSAS